MKTTIYSMAIILCVALSPAMCSAQQTARELNDWFSVLNQPAVQLELDFSDNQSRKVESLNNQRREISDELRNNFQSDRPKDESRDEARERIKKYAEMAEEKRQLLADELKDLLLPHQVTRMQQVTLQIKLQKSKLRQGTGLLAPELISLLKISPSQERRILQKEKEIKAKLEKKIKQLWLEAEEELREELTSKQRDEYKELVGEPFDLRKNQYQAMSLASGRLNESKSRIRGKKDSPKATIQQKTLTTK